MSALAESPFRGAAKPQTPARAIRGQEGARGIRVLGRVSQAAAPWHPPPPSRLLREDRGPPPTDLATFWGAGWWLRQAARVGSLCFHPAFVPGSLGSFGCVSSCRRGRVPSLSKRANLFRTSRGTALQIARLLGGRAGRSWVWVAAADVPVDRGVAGRGGFPQRRDGCHLFTAHFLGRHQVCPEPLAQTCCRPGQGCSGPSRPGGAGWVKLPPPATSASSPTRSWLPAGGGWLAPPAGLWPQWGQSPGRFYFPESVCAHTRCVQSAQLRSRLPWQQARVPAVPRRSTTHDASGARCSGLGVWGCSWLVVRGCSGCRDTQACSVGSVPRTDSATQ